MPKYGPTPPYRQRGTDGSSQLMPGLKGSMVGPEILSSDVGEWFTFNDGLPHELASVLIDDDLTVSARVTCEAEDTTLPKQSAFIVADQSFIRSAGVVVIAGAPIPGLDFTPNVGPWNLITATVVPTLPGGTVVWVVQDNRAVPAPIRWRALIRIYSAQARS